MATEQVWGITMVKDEADIIGYTLDHLIQQGVDGIIVADNLSQDKTLLICAAKIRKAAKSGVRVIVKTDNELGYYQSRKMTALARQAAELGAKWIIPFDADELWFSTSHKTLAGELRSQPPDVEVLAVPLYHHFPTSKDYEDKDNPFERMVYRGAKAGDLCKVCYRFKRDLVINMGNHSLLRNWNMVTPKVADTLKICHFPYRSAEQFIRKARNGAAAYNATDLPLVYGSHWRMYGKMSDEELRDWYWRNFFYLEPEEKGLVKDPAPFGDPEVRLWEKTLMDGLDEDY